MKDEMKMPQVKEFSKEFISGSVKKIIKELDENKSILVVADEKKISEDILLFMQGIPNQMPIVYVSLRAKQKDIEKELAEKRLDSDRVFYIDVAADQLACAKNCISIMKPSDLDSLLLAIGNYAKKMDGKFYLIFDSVLTLFIYNEPNVSLQFIHSALNKLRDTNIKSIFVTTPENLEKNKNLYTFFKKVIFI